VDSSSKHANSGDKYFELTVGRGEVIEGWDLGLMSMCLGEKCDLHIQPKYAFGEEGRPPLIPKNAPIVFRVELLQVGQRKCKYMARKSLPDEFLLKEMQM